MLIATPTSMNDDIRFAGVFFKEGRVVDIAIHNSGTRVGRRDDGAFGFAADETGPLPKWVGVGDSVEDVAADEAGCAGAGTALAWG